MQPHLEVQALTGCRHRTLEERIASRTAYSTAPSLAASSQPRGDARAGLPRSSWLRVAQEALRKGDEGRVARPMSRPRIETRGHSLASKTRERRNVQRIAAP